MIHNNFFRTQMKLKKTVMTSKSFDNDDYWQKCPTEYIRWFLISWSNQYISYGIVEYQFQNCLTYVQLHQHSIKLQHFQPYSYSNKPLTRICLGHSDLFHCSEIFFYSSNTYIEWSSCLYNIQINLSIRFSYISNASEKVEKHWIWMELKFE